MVRVRFERFGQPDLAPTWLDGATRAVPAEPFSDVDDGQGGVTRADIGDETIVPLDTFMAGAEVYVESEDVSDCLDDETPEAERASHIWWRAVVLGPEGS